MKNWIAKGRNVSYSWSSREPATHVGERYFTYPLKDVNMIIRLVFHKM